MKGANEISNTANVLDSRDIIDRIAYLESEREPLTDAVDQAQEALNDLDGDQFEEISEFEEAEQEAKDALAADRKSLPVDEKTAAKNPKGELDVKIALGYYSLGDWNKARAKAGVENVGFGYLNMLVKGGYVKVV